MNKKLIIFDFDGVIVDSEPIRYKTYKELFKREFLVDLPEKDLSVFGRTPRANLKYFLERFQLKGEIEELLEKRNLLLKEVYSKPENIIPINGVISLIKSLKSSNATLAIASSGNKEQIESILDHLNIKHHFDLIVSGDMINNSKPHPEIFIETAKRLGRDTKDCVVIEDSVNGLIAAKAASMKVIALSHTFPKEKLHLADMIISDFKNFPNKEIFNL